LDIDGVLLAKGGSQPEGIAEFLAFATASFECYWLTTHCKGDASNAIRYLSRSYPEQLVAQLGAIRPTNWDTLKTEAIDFSSPFVWLDDQPFEAEKRVLVQNNCSDSLLIVNLRNPAELKRITEILIMKSPHPCGRSDLV
jgi:hypothetical protein